MSSNLLVGQVAKEWIIGFDYYNQSPPYHSVFKTLNFKSSSTGIDTVQLPIRNSRNINRSLLADSFGDIRVFNLWHNLLASTKSIFYTGWTGNSPEYRQSMLVRNPKIDSIFYYCSVEHHNTFSGSSYSPGHGAYLSAFSDSLGSIKTINKDHFLDSLTGSYFYISGASAAYLNYTIFSFPHCNGTDVWVGFWHRSNRRFYSYLISDTGVSSIPVISPSFSQIDVLVDLAISPASNIIVVKSIDTLSSTYFDARHNAQVPDSSTIHLFTIQFNNSTGTFSSPASFSSKKIHSMYDYAKNLNGNSMAFSPNGRFLYNLNVGATYKVSGSFPAGIYYLPEVNLIEQFEYVGGGFNQSDSLTSFPHLSSRSSNGLLGPDDIALAPDGKIYIACDPGILKPKLGWINLPNKKGKACRLHLPQPQDTVGIKNLFFPRLPISSVTETYFFHKNACVKDTTLMWVKDTVCLDSLFWSFGDPGSGTLNTANGFAVEHQYNQAGTYNLKLYRYGQGFSDTLHKTITIEGRDTVHTRNDTLLCHRDTIIVGQNLGYEYNFLWSNRGLDSATQIHDTGWVWVEAFNNCITTRDSFYVNYASIPEVNLGNDTAGCDTFFLPRTTWPLSSYKWSTGDTTPFLGVSQTGAYQLTCTNICGSDSDVVQVNIHKNAQTAIPDTTICRGSRYTVSVPMPFTIYKWDNAIRRSRRTISGSGKYWLQTKNLCGVFSDTFSVKTITAPKVDLGKDTTICLQHPLLLSAGASDTALTWLWRHNNSTDSTALIQSSGTYQVAVTDQCGTVYDSVRVSTIAPPSLQLNDTAICNNDSILLSVVADSALFNWSTGATSNAIWIKEFKTYGVSATNKCGTDTNVFKVSELVPPSINFPVDTTICNREVWQLNVAQPQSTYAWSDGTKLSIKNITTAGNYSVTVTNACGSANRAVAVTYQKTPQVEIEMSAKGKFCPGTPVTLKGSSLTEEGVYTWSTGATSESVAVERIGEYTLTMSNFCGSSSKTISPNFYPLAAVFVLDRNEGDSPFMLNTTNQSTGATQYKWLLDSTVISRQLNTKHRVVPYGQHIVSLVVQNEVGCTDTATDTIQVDKNPNIPPYLCDFRIDPNPASDYFIISASNNDKQVRQIKIYNEQGQELISSDVSHWKENPFYYEQRFNNLPSGNYLVGLYCENEVKYKQVVIAR